MFRCVQKIFQFLKEIISQNLTLILGVQSKAMPVQDPYSNLFQAGLFHLSLPATPPEGHRDDVSQAGSGEMTLD